MAHAETVLELVDGLGSREVRPVLGPCVREERPTDISQYCGADRMKLRYARVCASQRRSRRKTPHFNLLRNPEPTTTPAGRVVLTVFAGVAQFERSLIGIRTEEGRRTAQARDVPFERPSKLCPDQRILARQLIEQEGQSVSEVAQPSISMPQRFFAAPHSGDLMTVHRSSRTHGPDPAFPQRSARPGAHPRARRPDARRGAGAVTWVARSHDLGSSLREFEQSPRFARTDPYG